MKPLTASEIEMLAASLDGWRGARLQEVRAGERWYELGFYKDGELRHLLISLQPQCPLVLPLKAPAVWREKKTPCSLFLKAHLVGQRLSAVKALKDMGRVLELQFGPETRLELRLFPRGQNMIITAGEKRISAFKVQELPPSQNVPTLPAPRSLNELCEAFAQTLVAAAAPAPRGEDQREKILAKKRAAREKMLAEINEKKNLPYQDLGQWLKTHQSLDVPAEWSAYVDARLSFAENLQNVFARAKELRLKVERAEERLRLLEEEIRRLEAGESPAGVMPRQKQESLLRSADVKGRTFPLSSGQVFYVGKSAADNVKLLREASPWDYWLHLKDYPGSHGILRRGRSEKVTDAAFIEAFQHLVRATFGDKAPRHAGERFDGLVAECRFIRPIKGDRLGRVTYQNERVLRFVYGGA